MPFLNLPTGVRLHYERQGNGPPLVLIMGTGLDCSCWTPQVEAYQEDFDCIRFDNRGAGKTKAPAVPLSVPLMAEDTAALLESLDAGPVHVSGLSLGSCIAQELALNHPELVLTLQLHGTWGRAHGYAARKFRAQLKLLETLDLASFYAINVLWFITPEAMHRHPDRVEQQIRHIVGNLPDRELLRQQYQADLDHDALERLHAIQAPTLITVGSFDLALPPMYAQEVADAIPGSELVIFRDGGHLHNLERPEEFNRVTLDFLRRHRAPPPA